jgi:hypothetical protein
MPEPIPGSVSAPEPGAPGTRPAPPPATREGVDPRGTRFSAGVTALLLGVDIVLGSAGGGGSTAAVWLLALITAVFAWGAFAGVRRHPYGWLFRALVRPRLGAPAELEAPEPPTFAQLVGLVISAIGLILGLIGLQWGLVAAAALAFIASFLNAAFGYCLGCELYLLLQRARRGGAAAA